MHSRTVDFPVVLFVVILTVGLVSGLVGGLVGDLGLLLSATPASAESVPFNCSILPGAEIASITITNSLASDASCIVTCKFSTTKYDNNPQITCAKPVPAGKEVEMCLLPGGGNRLVKLTEGRAECTR